MSLVLPESPALLIETDRLEEAKESLENIAQWNSQSEKFYLSECMKSLLNGTQALTDFDLTASTIEISNLPHNIPERLIR